MLVKHERSCWTKDGNQLKILQIAGHEAAAEPVGELGGGAGDADGGKFRARGDHLRVVRALRPLDALQNVLRAVLERAVGRGLILEEDGHAAVVGRPAAEVRRGLAPLPEAFVAALLFELQIAVFDVLRAAHEPDDMVARALEVGADVEKVLLHE